MSAPPIKQAMPTRARYRLPTTAFRHMAWKELRQNAPLLAVFVVVMIITLAVVSFDQYWGTTNVRPRQAFWFSIILAFSNFFAFTLGVFLFAPEKEGKTSQLLSHLPITSGFVVRAKLINGLLAVICFLLIGAMLQLVELFAFQTTINIGIEPLNIATFLTIALGIIFLPLECLLWGAICSLVIKRTVYAAIAGTACVLGVCWILPTMLMSTVGFDPPHPGLKALAFMAAIKLIFFLFGFLLMYRLGAKWLGNSPQLEPIRNSLSPSIPLRLQTQADQNEKMAIGRYSSTPLRVYRSLIWQSFRQYHWPFLIAVLCGLPFLLIGFSGLFDRSNTSHLNTSSLFLAGLVITTFIGSLFTFAADNRDNNYLFFQQHVEHGRMLWLARLFPACILSAIALCVSVAVLVVINIRFAYVGVSSGSELLSVVCLGIVSALAIGQFSSMLFRSGVFTFGSAIFMLVVARIWIGWLVQLNANLWLYFAPVPLALLAITWWYAPRWLAGKNRTSDLAVPHAAALLIALSTLGAFTYQRYSEYPSVQFSLSDQMKTYTGLERQHPVEHEGSRLIGEAASVIDLSPNDQEFGKFTVPANWTRLIFNKDRLKDADKFLQANQGALDLISRAMEHDPNVPLLDPRSLSKRADQAAKIRILLAVAANQSEFTGDLDTALHYWTLLLKFDERYPGFYAQGNSIDGLLHWSELPGQTPELLKKAIGELSFTPTRWERYADNSTFTHLLDFENWYQEFLTSKFASAQGSSVPILFPDKRPRVFVAAEKERSRRIAHQLIAGAYRRIFEVNSELAINPVTSFSDHWGKLFPNSAWFSLGVDYALTFTGALKRKRPEFFYVNELGDAGAVFSVLWTIQGRRYAQVRLALNAWRIDNGSYPKTLEELVPKYLDELPVDVFYGRPFDYAPSGLNKPVSTNSGVPIDPHTPFVIPWSVATTDDSLFDYYEFVEVDQASAHYVNLSDPSIQPPKFEYSFELPIPKSLKPDPAP